MVQWNNPLNLQPEQSGSMSGRDLNLNVMIRARELDQRLKGKSVVDKIIFKKQIYQLLNTSREIFPSFHASNFHKFDD